jgi:hypothetical protein
MTELDMLQQNIEYDASGNIEYIGYAVPGSGEHEPVWLIQKFFYDASNNSRKRRFAEAKTNFTLKWSQKEDYDYGDL